MQEQAHDLDSLAALVEGRLGEQDKRRVMVHLADCVECRRTFARVSREHAAGTLPSAGGGNTSKPRLLTSRPWLAIAASVLLATVGWFYFSPPPRGTDVTSPAGADLLRRRGTERTVEDKTFRLTAGVWVDTRFDASAGLDSVSVTGPEERAAVLGKNPQLAPYAGLGERVVVVWERTVYRFEP
jgi:hypothetical protein